MRSPAAAERDALRPIAQRHHVPLSVLLGACELLHRSVAEAGLLILNISCSLGDIRPRFFSWRPFSELGVSMAPLQQHVTTLTDARLAGIADSAANLKAQLFELERLREQVGKALLSAEKSRQKQRVSCADAKNRSENRRSVSPT